MKQSIIIALAALLLQGCVPVYVPPVWDVGDEIHDADEIVEGVTTKTEVLELLGEPHWVHGRSFRYSGSTSSGAWALLAATGNAAIGGFIDAERWWVYVSYDEDDYVETFATSRSPWVSPEERADLEKKANRGDARAKYQLGRRTSLYGELGAERLEWICASANEGYTVARYQMGRYFETLPEPDYIQAYFWQSLVAGGKLPAASAAQRRLERLASPEDTQDAKVKLASWRPDQTYCDQLISDVRLEEARVRAEREAEAAAKALRGPEEEFDLLRMEAPSAFTGASAADEQYQRGRYFYEKSYALDGEWREFATQEAWYWTCLSAHHGQPQGQYLLGFWLSQDASSQRIAPGPKDENQAYVWYSRAAAQGLKVAQTAKADAKEDMNSTMTAEAELFVQTWQPDPASCGEPPTAGETAHVNAS